MPGGGRQWKTLVSQLRVVRRDIEFPTVAHRPWKSPKARFPHFHSAGDISGFLFPAQTDRDRGACVSGFRSMARQWARAATTGASRQEGESLIPGRLD